MNIFLFFLTVLKIIGIILLVLFLLLFIVLIAPIKYDVAAEKNENIKISVFVSWLFGVFKIWMDKNNGDDIELSIKICGFKLGKKTKAKKKVNTKTNVKTEEKKQEKQKEIPKKDSIEKEETQEKDSIEKEETQDEVFVRRVKMVHTEPQKDELEAEPENESEMSLKTYIIKMPMSDKKLIVKEACRLVKSIFKGILPGDFSLDMVLGTNDPALTGQIVGFGYAVGGIYDKHIVIVPDFEEEKLEGKLKIKGKVIIGALMVYALRFIVKKPVINIIKFVLKGKGEKHGE